MSFIRAANVVLCMSQFFKDLFAFFAICSDEGLALPENLNLCQHMNPVKLCDGVGGVVTEEEENAGTGCLSENDLKYRFVRVAIDSIDLHFMEDLADFRVLAETFRLSNCNAHATVANDHFSVLLNSLKVLTLVFLVDKLILL